jgi:PGF-CTERM protein
VFDVQVYNCTCGDICVNTTGWWRDGGAFNASGTRIQAAVDNATAGETIYVAGGSYTENVNVDERLTLRGEGADVVNVTAASVDDHVFEVQQDYVNISGFNVTGATGSEKAGIYLSWRQHGNITDNNASGNRYGIHLSHSRNNTLAGNTANSNVYRGIALYSSSNNTLTNNTASNNPFDGIYLSGLSNNNTLTSNTASNNTLDGIALLSSSNNTLTSNTASNNTLDGIYLYHSSNNTLTNNTANSNSQHGIFLRYSSSNTLTSNTADSNTQHGIYLCDLSNNNTIYNNHFNNTNNAYDDGYNIWNTTKTAGMNIIGGSWLGGNYWSDYAGADTNGDDLGDTLTPYNSSSNITFGGDYHPLVTPGFAAPNITSSAPESPVNDTYCTWTKFNVSVDQTVNVTWYLNETAQTPVNESVTEANYTFHAEYICENNVSALAENANGTDMQTWVWNVTAAPTYNCTCGDICVNTTGWWRDCGTFNANGTPIQAAVDAATAGETICVGDGTYHENVNVGKRLTIRSENGSANCIVNASDSGDHVFEVTVDYMNISGFTATGATDNWKAGIYLNNGVSDCNISNNNCSNNHRGIYLPSSSNNNTLTNNTANSNSQHGILLISSSNNNTLTENTANSNSQHGIYLGDSSNNNTLANNTANANDWYGIHLLFSSNNNTLTENTANSNTRNGIILTESSSNTLTENTANSNTQYGIFLECSCNDNTLTENTANSNTQYGVYLRDADNNNVSCNLVQSNIVAGFYLDSGSTGNTIGSNTASNNTHGIYLTSSSNNTIYNNYFNNTNNAYDTGYNIWNTTKTAGTNIIGGSWLGGNYWSDYAGVDTDGDGLGDTLIPYNSSGNIQNGGDYHPLVIPGVAIYVPDNYTTIQSAVDNASGGDTIIVRDGTYTENVDVDKRLTIRSENGSDSTIVSAANSSHNVFKVTADYVTISGFTVTGATKDLDISGIYLSDADYCDISNIKASNNGAGIFLFNSSNNTIKNNAVNSNEWTGIYVEFSSNNTIASNIASTNGEGICLGRFTSSNIVTNNTASNNHDGIRLYSSGNNKLTNNNASNNNCGIYLFHSSNNTFSGNTALNNTDVDFSDEGSRDNSIVDFTISRYPTTISFIYEHGIGIKSVTVPEPDPAGKANIGKYVNATNATEDSWILLSASYSDADITNVKEDSLRLYRWTGTNWAEIPGSGVNTVENYVYANVTSFSQIAAFGDPTPSGGGGGGGGGGTYPPGWFGTPTATVTATKAPAASATGTATAAPPGERVTPAATKAKPAAAKATAPAAEGTATKKPAKGAPGFTAVFVIAGMLAAVYAVMRRRG